MSALPPVRIKLGLLSLFCGIFGIVFLSSGSAYAATYINLSGSNDTISFGKVQPSSTGTVSTASDTLSIDTNCSAGINVYISGQSGKGTSLVNAAADSNNEINTLSGTTIGSTALSLQNNTWGFNTDSSSTNNGNGAYYGLPTYTDRANHAIYTGTNNSLSINYGTKVTTTLTPGKYTGNILYTATVASSCLNYTVIFDKNANDATGTMNNQSIPPSTATNLTANTYTRSGYTFLGWSTDKNATNPTYADKQSVTDLAPEGSDITLYAIWGYISGDMQNWNGCSELSINDIRYLQDSRDNNVYAIKKLKDGNCWMVQNLRLANYNLTPEDSDVTADFDLTSGVIYSGSSGWCTTSTAECDNTKALYYDPNTRSSSGALYNYYTATAGTGTHDIVSGDATGSVCPKGWRLPTGGPSGEFAELDIALGGTGTSRANANTYSIITGNYAINENGGFYATGSINGGSLAQVGEQGHWHTSTSTGNGIAYRINTEVSTSSLNPTGGGYKYLGRSVRCIANQSMQSWSGCDDLVSGNSIILTDSRDKRKYTVRKLEDGKCWMTNNLALGSGSSVTLTPADSNVTENFTLEASNLNNFTTATGDAGKIAATYYRAEGEDNVPEDTTYYSFYAASAGFSWQGDGINYGYANSSICPKGWRLPSGKNGSDFKTLSEALGGSGEETATSTTIRDAYTSTTGPALAYSGFISAGTSTGSISNTTAIAGYWTSLITNSTNARLFQLRSSDGRYQNMASDNKYQGYPVRCIKSENYTINYNTNDSTSGTISKNTEGIVKHDGSITMPTVSGLTKSGYTFAGWSPNPNNITHASYNPGKEYPVEDIIYDAKLVNSNIPNGDAITLYAVWIPNTVDGNMQNWSGCTNMDINDSVRLRDARDQRVYTVRKLADNKCWMVENLALNSGQAITLNSDNSNIEPGTTFTISASNISGINSGGNTYAYYAPKGSTANFSTAPNNYPSTGSIPEDTTYYNFYTATAGFSYSNDGKTSGTSTYSICPKGWHLSSGGNDGEFAALDIAYGGTGTNRSSPNYRNKLLDTDGPAFVYSGTAWGNLVHNANQSGFWFTSSINSNNKAFYLSLNLLNSIAPMYTGDKDAGSPIRCIADSPAMQDWSGCDSMTTGQATILKDTRDDREYRVRKLEDGKCWMTQNLALGSGNSVTLTPADSNVAENFTLEASSLNNFTTSTGAVAATYYVPKGTSSMPEDTTFYNFYAATAGFSYYGDNVPFGYSDYDICPKGWRLPSGKNGGDFKNLSEIFGGSGEASATNTTVRDRYQDANGPALAYSGIVNVETNSTSLINVTSNAYYWTSTITDTASSRFFRLRTDGVYWNMTNASKYYGFAARCIAKSEEYTINYSINGATSGTISKNTEGEVKREDSITMPTVSGLTKSGYTFAGWSPNPNNVTHASYSPGTSYLVENIAYDAKIVNNNLKNGDIITLYAVWIPDAVDDNMQNWNNCSNLNVGNTVRLKDTRDQRVYAVRKLVDGKCWMVENLALGSGQAVTLNSDNSNLTVGNTFTIGASNIAGANGANAYTYYAPKGSSDNFATGPTEYKSTGVIPEDTTYYNFYAATIGLSHQSDGVTSGSSTQSVCPKGWHLPSGGATGEYTNLDKAFGGTGSNRYSPNYRDKFMDTDGPAFVYSGLVWSRKLHVVSERGMWWTSQIYNSDASYVLSISMRSLMNPQNMSNKDDARPVRCIADN